METSHPDLRESVYQWQEYVEDLECYQPGGYHPTHIGDQHCNGRYEVVHKLGWGSYSTVWLARDHKESRYVALKIIVASSSENCSEGRILRGLAAGKADHPGKSFVSSLLDEFFIDGPNGRHLCIVSEAAGCSLDRSKNGSSTWLFPADVARAISAQLLLGLEFIHSCGIVHGDLHPSNILFTSSNLDGLTLEELYQRMGEPRKVPVERLDKQPNGPQAPNYAFMPAMIFTSAEDVVDARVVIADFGEAFVKTEERKKLNTPILLQPPEAFFNEQVDEAVDVWTLGCTLYKVLGDGPLFDGFIAVDQAWVLAEMISTLGSLPKRWWDQWEMKTDFLLEDGSWKKETHRPYGLYSRPLTERLSSMGRGEDPSTCEFSPGEMNALENLLRAMLTYEPSERIDASTALESEWMEDWGRPAMRKLGFLTTVHCFFAKWSTTIFGISIGYDIKFRAEQSIRDV
ncbi:protein kinase [Aspergillus heteromorphus CBS 117.55]|uniref:non-specific serine/threonine protein kinase n=1 Tax=Aspergillus heteromorphus CBS 117.55 TaxID=1448321 RepID=A0A317WRD8_9EURO|nr:protein kinase [Aspergillus heteromorphus CBS 117.55]PWY88291.1 protein kinase [Aspergillus heteromorphus CBS 117.55]